MLDGISATLLWSQHPQAGSVTCIAVDPHSTRVVSGGLVSGRPRQAVISSWDIINTREPLVLATQTSSIFAIGFNPEGSLLASAGDDAFVYIREGVSGRELRRLGGHQGTVFAVAFSPDGTTLASAGADARIRLSNVATGTLLRSLTGHQDGITSLAWSPDGSMLASGSWDATVRLWDPTEGRELSRVLADDQVCAVAFSPDGSTLASAGSDESISIWELGAGEAQVSLSRARVLTRHVDMLTSIAFHPSAKLLAAGILRSEEPVEFWEPQSGHFLEAPQVQSDELNALAFSADGRFLACGGGGRHATIEVLRITVP